MRERVLGTVFEGRDQGQAMLASAFSWLIYLILVSIADASWSSSLVSALTRLASVGAFVVACSLFLKAMPRFLHTAARITAVTAIAGAIVQLSGVLELMQRVPNFGNFEAAFYFAQLIYAFALFPFAYCIYNHPLFPKWLGIALVVDGLFWIAYYVAAVNKFAYILFEALAWGPSLVIEILTGVYFVWAGWKLLKMTAPEERH